MKSDFQQPFLWLIWKLIADKQGQLEMLELKQEVITYYRVLLLKSYLELSSNDFQQ